MTLQEARHICRVEYISGIFLSLRETYIGIRDALGEAEAQEGYRRCISHLIDEYIMATANGFLSNAEFVMLMAAISDWKKSNDAYISTLEQIEKTHAEGSLSQGGEKATAEAYRDYHVGYVLVPENLNELPLLTPRGAFIAPETVDLRDYCCATRDQGSKPWCAAYAATGFASNVNWRKDDIPMQYDPAPVYAYAKTIDGSPNTDGTSLNAVLQSLLNDGWFDKSICSVKILRTKEQVKYAVHKYGCCLAGLNVSREWYTCNKNKSTISGKKDTEQIGGHAVLVCGYNRDGVIIQNSWGTDWGAYGFALIVWKEFEREFMYGAVLDNCLYNTKMN